MVYLWGYRAGFSAVCARYCLGTAGAAAVPLIPIAVTAGALYGGTMLAKGAYKKGKKGRKFRQDQASVVIDNDEAVPFGYDTPSVGEAPINMTYANRVRVKSGLPPLKKFDGT